MAPQKRRKLSYDDAESSNTSEITESRLHAPVDGASQESEVDTEKPLKDGSVASLTDSEMACRDKLETESQLPSSGVFPEKDVPRRLKAKPTRISERLIIKRNRLEETEDDCSGPSQTQTPPRKGKALSSAALKQQQKKDDPKGKKLGRRPCAVWTVHDKRLFFMYIGEYGKNFEAISKKLSHVARMRNAPQKDKVQVGYFYYRCWAKISKFIRLSETSDVKTVTQELYGLINYGVLRNYFKETDAEFGRCLNELIYYGETSCMLKVAKTKRLVKLKTPRCTYLKKINRIEDKIFFGASSTKIPTQVTLELTPKNSSAWAKVQELSQNPRIRFKLSTHRTLESVFRYLGSKWKSNRIKLKEALGGKEEDGDEEMACTLHPSCTITPVMFIPQEPRRLLDITFKNYRENVLPFLVKKKKSKSNKDQEKNVDEAPASAPPQHDQDNENRLGNEEAGDPLSKTSQCEDKNSDKNVSVVEAMECLPAEDNPTENRESSPPPKSPLSKLPTVSSSVPGLPEDENAVFMDLSKFPQPSTPDNTQKGPLSPVTSVTSKSSPPLKSQSVLNVVVPSPLPALSVPSSLFSPSSSKANVILSPSLSKKKLTKSAKKRALSLDSNTSASQDISDNISVQNPANASDSFPNKSDAVTTAAKTLTEEAEKEYERLCNLSSSGFTQANANNVTLLHLSLILGKASVIRLEYEWREKVKTKPHLLPAFCKATSQMANVLRRLCNIAQLELTSFQQETKMSDASKGQTAKSNAARCKNRDGVRDISTMTDPIKPTLLSHSNARTFIAANSPQLNGHDSVFRVPLVPAGIHQSAPSKEEQEKLKLQEQQAKAILQQGPKNRLLKKRTLTPKTRKPPPIIVQRTLLPKVSSPLITYVQGLGGQPQMVVKVKADDEVPSQPSPNNSSTDAVPDIPKFEQIAKNGSNILHLAAQAAEIDETSAVSQDSILELRPTADFTVAPQSAAIPPVSVPVPTLTSSTNLLSSESPIKNVSTVTSQSDISFSDFDISLSSANASNMGPDAGDKFLDSVLQNSQQGFSGLINSTTKSQEFVSDGSSQLQSISVDTDLAGFASSLLHTPPHSSSSSYNPPASSLEFPSPMNINMADQPWLSTDPGDISLSSILGESSAFDGHKPKLKTPTKSTDMSTLSRSMFFDGSSSDAVDNPVISPNKSPFVSEMSLSCLLNDSNLGAPKNVESLNSVSNESLAVSKETNSDNIFSSVVSSEVPPSTLFSEASQDSFTKLDVDVTFQGMVSESSMDFVTKFEKLAAHITENQDLDSASNKLNTPVKRECDCD